MRATHPRSRLAVLRLPCLLLMAAALTHTAAGANAPVDPLITKVIAELEKTRVIRQAALSPDGQMIAWVTDAAAGTEITIASTADPSRSHRLTAGTGAPCTEENLAWSPDSKALAFTSDCNDGATGQADVYLAAPNSASAAARRLTHLHGGISSLAFSPDGLHIACLYIEGATRPAGALAPMKPPAGVIGVEGLEIQRIATVETASGEFREVTPATLHVYEIRLGARLPAARLHRRAAPRGKQLVGRAALHPAADRRRATLLCWRRNKHLAHCTACRSPCPAGRQLETRSPSLAA